MTCLGKNTSAICYICRYAHKYTRTFIFTVFCACRSLNRSKIFGSCSIKKNAVVMACQLTTRYMNKHTNVHTHIRTRTHINSTRWKCERKMTLSTFEKMSSIWWEEFKNVLTETFFSFITHIHAYKLGTVLAQTCLPETISYFVLVQFVAHYFVFQHFVRNYYAEDCEANACLDS